MEGALAWPLPSLLGFTTRSRFGRLPVVTPLGRLGVLPQPQFTAATSDQRRVVDLRCGGRLGRLLGLRWRARRPSGVAVFMCHPHAATRRTTDEERAAGETRALWRPVTVVLELGVILGVGSYLQVAVPRMNQSEPKMRWLAKPLISMTAESYPFDHAFLAKVATRIVNEVRGINRVVYDVTSKPPGTIEWE